jgi:hypothetical protein
VLWLETEQPERERIAQAFRWLRRLGTTDSLATCRVGEGTPTTASCIKPAGDLAIQATNFAQRAVFTLHELKAEAQFVEVNHVLPCVREQVGENWIIYRREPFAS